MLLRDAIRSGVRNFLIAEPASDLGEVVPA